MTYTELRQAILDYIEAGDTSFVAHIPDFVRSTEQKVYNMVQLPVARKNASLTTAMGVPTVSAPADFLYAFSLAVVLPDSTRVYLLNKDQNYLDSAFPDPTYTDVPSHYTLADYDTFQLAPVPDAAYSLDLVYSAYPESIVTAGTTWLGNNFDTVLLYGSLVEANMYIKGEADMTALYQKQFEESLARLKMLGDGKNRQDAYRSGQVRTGVR